MADQWVVVRFSGSAELRREAVAQIESFLKTKGIVDKDVRDEELSWPEGDQEPSAGHPMIEIDNTRLTSGPMD